MISLDIDERAVARIVIDNPRKLNILDSAHMVDLARRLEEIGSDDTIRAVVLTGAGDRAFIGGADVREMSQLDPAGAREFITRLHACCEGIRNLPFPAIARISGYALGAGLEIAAACDLRIASESSRVGMPEVRVGIPSVIEAALLPTLIGWGRARRLMLLGETYPAREAEKWGLIDQVVADGELDRAVEAALASILRNGANAIRLQKQLIRKWEDLPLKAAIAAGIEVFSEAFVTDEPRLMMQAFLEKRNSPPGGSKR
jgi:enoyl-CoA hydratase/carnithine racemase